MGGGVILGCSFLCVAVNLFVLISGYFGIKLSMQSIPKFWLLCVFYNLIAFGVQQQTTDFSFKDFVFCFFITKTGNWFFPAYLWLMVLSPLLNHALQEISYYKLRFLVLLIVALNVISGFVLHYQANPSGYTVLHLVMIYVIGGYLRREKSRIKKSYYLYGYILLSLINAILCYVMVHLVNWNGMMAFNYNNPIVIVSAVSLFLFFEGLNIQSIGINRFSRTVVAALLIQDVVLKDVMVTHLKEQLNQGLFNFATMSTIWFVAFFAVAFIVESIRMSVTDKLLKMISKRISIHS